MKRLRLAAIFAAVAATAGAVSAQNPPAAPQGAPATPPAPPRGPPPTPALGDGPWDIATEKQPVRVSVVTKGLDRPWGLAFVPGSGDMLITERVGRLRLIKDGKLDPTPIAGLPPIHVEGIGGLHDIVLHPKFARNRLLYLAYVKPDPNPAAKGQTTLAVLRARWDGGHQLTDVRDIFVADAWYGAPPLPKRCCGQGPASGSHGGRLAFGRDGKLYITSGDRNYGEKVQDPSNHFGKILRLNDDGSIPRDNPFVGKAGYKPEIWTTGHRNPLGLAFHPTTGELWESEFGPMGGDEVNVIRKGHNYGWIDVTQGQHYSREPAKGIKGVAGMDDPVFAFGPPSINPGNLAFYEGRRFPGWRGDMLMPTMSRSVVRASFDRKGQPIAQELMLTDLKQRFRDIRVGPDGNIYLLTDETAGALLKVEPGRGASGGARRREAADRAAKVMKVTGRGTNPLTARRVGKRVS